MSFNPQQKAIITESVTAAYKEVLSVKIKKLDARRVVPFLAKGEEWTSLLKYWVTKGNTEIQLKKKTDTEGNNINLQIQAIADEIPRFPIDLKLPLVVFKEYERNKAGLINYLKAHIEEALKAYNIFVNDFCLVGHKNFTGLVNDPDIGIHSTDLTLAETDGTVFFTKTNAYLQSMVTNSSKAFEPHQLAVSPDFFTKLVSLTIGASSQTVLDKLLNENPYLRASRLADSDKIIQLGELSGAGVGGKDRLIALADSENGTNYHFEENMRMVQYAEGFNEDYFYKKWENRSAGLMIDHLLSIRYADIAAS